MHRWRDNIRKLIHLGHTAAPDQAEADPSGVIETERKEVHSPLPQTSATDRRESPQQTSPKMTTTATVESDPLPIKGIVTTPKRNPHPHPSSVTLQRLPTFKGKLACHPNHMPVQRHQ